MFVYQLMVIRQIGAVERMRLLGISVTSNIPGLFLPSKWRREERSEYDRYAAPYPLRPTKQRVTVPLWYGCPLFLRPCLKSGTCVITIESERVPRQIFMAIYDDQFRLQSSTRTRQNSSSSPGRNARYGVILSTSPS